LTYFDILSDTFPRSVDVHTFVQVFWRCKPVCSFNLLPFFNLHSDKHLEINFSITKFCFAHLLTLKSLLYFRNQYCSQFLKNIILSFTIKIVPLCVIPSGEIWLYIYVLWYWNVLHIHKGKGKGKVVPVLQLSTTPWRHSGGVEV
jgi:hypothetical protein